MPRVPRAVDLPPYALNDKSQRALRWRMSPAAEAEATLEAIAQCLLDRIVSAPNEPTEPHPPLISPTLIEGAQVVDRPRRDFVAEEVTALVDYDLSHRDGRLAFLYALFMEHYRHGLFLAVQHVWASLAPPKAARCRLMAQQLKLPGTGKRALKNVLAAFLDEALYGIDFPPLPDMKNYTDGPAWNDACIEHFGSINARFEDLYHRYEAILDGRMPNSAPPGVSILKGPWKQV